MIIVFATNNKHKIEEVKRLLENKFQLLSLKDIHCDNELPETGDTLEENASQKANYIYTNYRVDCFADDTGLEIEALNGKPGVLSARYAGKEKDPAKNIDKVLNELKNSANRKARFRTVISLIINNKEYFFDGIINGKIAEEKQGKSGFGYDPIFIPEGQDGSFAEMSLEEKNKVSHRAIAIKKLAEFLHNF